MRQSKVADYCFENMALTLTEDLIRNRVSLQHDNLGRMLYFSAPSLAQLDVRDFAAFLAVSTQ